MNNPDFPDNHPLRTNNHMTSCVWINPPNKDKIQERLANIPDHRVMKTHNSYQHLNIEKSNKTFKVIY